MKEEDREIWVGENRYYLSEDNILHITNVGPLDTEQAAAVREALMKLKSMSKGKMDVLVDLNQAGQASSKAREIFKGMSEDENVEHVAIFGAHPVAKVLASFFMGASKNRNIRFFKIKEEALEWLKEEP